MIGTWQQLEAMRLAGQRPALPVVVTTREWLGKNLNSTGVMTIVHKAGDPMPVKLLEGLHVMLMLEGCEQAARVMRLMREREIVPASCEGWCRCHGELNTVCAPCDELHEIDRLLEASSANHIQ